MDQIFYIDGEGVKYDQVVSEYVVLQEEKSRIGDWNVDPSFLVSADHCQKGSSILVYKIKVCKASQCNIKNLLSTNLMETIKKASSIKNM